MTATNPSSVDLGRDQIMVRGGKGNKDRVVMLPRKLKPTLAALMEYRSEQHQRRPGPWQCARRG